VTASVAGDDGQGVGAAQQPFAVVDYQAGYRGLIAAFRQRVFERGISVTSQDIAEISGLPSHYFCKILSPSPNPSKRFGAASLGPILACLGLRIVLCEDPQAIQKYAARIPRRNESFVHAGTMVEIKFTRRKFREIQAKGRRARWDSMTAKQRSAWARKLNRARWQRKAANGAAVDR
jgi:hypothetical protein